MHNISMGRLSSSRYFVAALWAGLAAPTALFGSPPKYPYYIGTYSVPQSFAQVGSYLSYALSRYRDDESKRSRSKQR
jgi:hypothetical protein